MTSTRPRPRALLWLISFLLCIGVVALGLSVQNAINLDRQAEQREADRVQADVEGCERGNELRQQIIDGLNANGDMVVEILDSVFITDDPAQQPLVDSLRQQLDRPIAEYRDAIAAITLTDCQQAVPGAESKEPTKEQP